MTKVSASLSVGFDSTSNPVPLTLETHKGPYAEYGWIPLRLYPVVPAILRATRGEVHMGETRTESVQEILSFSGGKTATTKRPNPIGIAFESVGVALDDSGYDVFPVLHYDPDRREVVSDIPFYGGFKASYTADYSIVYYRYATDYLPYGSGVMLSSGTVFAFYDKESASLEIKIEGEDGWMTELYRVYSNIVLDEDGAWEEPPGWTGDGKFPISGAKTLDPNNAFTDERKHRIGYINRLGTTSFTWFFASNLQPYSSIDSYKPKYKLRWASAPDDRWASAFAGIDKTAIAADLSKSFPGLTVA